MSDTVSRLREQIRHSEQINLSFMAGGSLAIERPLPFVCLFRKRSARSEQAEKILRGLSSIAMTEAYLDSQQAVAAALGEVMTALKEVFGQALLVEIWEADESAHPQDFEGFSHPCFQIFCSANHWPDRFVDALQATLKKVSIIGSGAEVNLEHCSNMFHPPNLSRITTLAEFPKGIDLVGIEIDPIYRNAKTGELYPIVFRQLQRALLDALNEAFHAYVKEHAPIKIRHFHALGKTDVPAVTWEVDHQLATIKNQVDLVLAATPINVKQAWADFQQSGFSRPPMFAYRPSTIDPVDLKRQLHSTNLLDVEDASLFDLFARLQDDIDRRITMLSDLDSINFFYGSLQIYGRIEPELKSAAVLILRDCSPIPEATEESEPIDSYKFQDMARKEIEHYQRRFPASNPTVCVSPEVSGIIVSRGCLYLADNLELDAARARALLHHEVGTHILTWLAGSDQPIKLLSSGLRHYEELQEGLAVLGEYFAGSLSTHRLRLLATRVLAADAVISGADFLETFALLRDECEQTAQEAFYTAMRVHRGGGFIKDLIYLRGVTRLLKYLQNGGEFELLFAGKYGFDDLGLIGELVHRDIVQRPRVLPRYTTFADFDDRLSALRSGLCLTELVTNIKESKS